MTRLALALALLAAASPLSGQRRPELDSIFRGVDTPDAPGCALGVARDGRALYTAGYGSANLDYGLPVTPASVFYLASVSKQFTAASVALAAREGHLSLGDDIRRWLPELPQYARPITVRHLIHHTSGLRDYLTLLPLGGRPLQNVLTDADLLALIARQRDTNFEPGSEYLYSNTGYVLLAEIVKRATGRSLRQYAHEKIFQPLGMNDTHFHDDANAIVKNRVIGYGAAGDAFVINHAFHFDKVGDGGLYSTVDDLLKWAVALEEGTLVDAAFVASLEQRGTLANGSAINYAFGQQHAQIGGLPVIEHGGSLTGFRTHLLRLPQQKTSVVVLCNSPRLAPAAAARRVATVLLGDMMKPEVTGQPQPAPQPQPQPQPEAVPDPRPYPGSYYSQELDATYVVSLGADTLTLRMPNRAPQILRQRAPSVLTAGTLVLRFDTEGFLLDAGRVRNLRFVRR